MSFILDALRKSEHARQHLGGATLAELPLGRRTRGQPWWVYALAALLVVNLSVLMMVLLRNEKQSTSIVQSPPPMATPIAPAAAPTMVPSTPSMLLSTTPPATPPTLADEATPPAEVEYETVPRSESPLAFASTSNVPDGPALVRRLDNTNTATQAIPMATTTNGFPVLHIDMHVYAINAKDRFVIINMHKYVEGDTLTEGPEIDEITPDGVTLFYKGQKLSLPRP